MNSDSRILLSETARHKIMMSGFAIRKILKLIAELSMDQQGTYLSIIFIYRRKMLGFFLGFLMKNFSGKKTQKLRFLSCCQFFNLL